MDLTLSPAFNALISIKFMFAEHNYVQFFNTDSHIRDGINKVNSFRPKVRFGVYLQLFL